MKINNDEPVRFETKRAAYTYVRRMRRAALPDKINITVSERNPAS